MIRHHVEVNAEFFRFLATGGLSTVLDALLFRSLIWLGWQPVSAYPASYATCVALRYLNDSRFTFATQRRHMAQFLGYLGVNLLAMLSGLLTMRLLLGAAVPIIIEQGWLDAAYGPLAAKLGAIPVTVLAGIIGMRLLVFRSGGMA